MTSDKNSDALKSTLPYKIFKHSMNSTKENIKFRKKCEVALDLIQSCYENFEIFGRDASNRDYNFIFPFFHMNYAHGIQNIENKEYVKLFEILCDLCVTGYTTSNWIASTRKKRFKRHTWVITLTAYFEKLNIDKSCLVVGLSLFDDVLARFHFCSKTEKLHKSFSDCFEIFLICSFLLASKIHEDAALWLYEIQDLFPNIRENVFGQVELVLLRLLDWTPKITNEDYIFRATFLNELSSLKKS